MVSEWCVEVVVSNGERVVFVEVVVRDFER